MLNKSLLNCVLLALAVSLVTCSLNTSPVNADALDREISDYHATLISKAMAHEAKAWKSRLTRLGSGGLGEAKKFECTGGVDPSNLSEQDYLKAFRKSSCSPVIAIAGVMGTKLQVLIDCEILKKQQPVLFDICGWSTCSWSLLGNKPKAEYTMWIPTIMSPFTLASPLHKKKECMAGLFGTSWTKTSNKLVLNPLEGVTIKAMGYTQKTRETSNCGFESISNLIPIREALNPAKYKMFTFMKNELLWRGYKLGINAFGLPYDWRASFAKNDITRRFAKLVKNVAQISRKRVVIVAHSMGNLNTVNNLANLDQSFKDKYIEKYFAIAAPYLGAPIAFKYMIGGNPDFFMKGFGMNFWLFKRVAAFIPSLYDLMPRMPWVNFKDTYWMKSIKNRISKEKNMPLIESVPESEDIVSSLFPDHSVTCSQIKYLTRENKCLTGLDDFYEIANVGGNAVTLENIKESFAEFCFDPTAADLYVQEKEARDAYDAFPNPGVETILVYSNINRTPQRFYFNHSPKEKASEEFASFVAPDQIIEGLGDGTVLGTSTLVPGIKWAYEFEKEQAGAKPVTFADVCMNFNSKQFIRSQFEPAKNQYIGIPCDCISESESSCDHLGIVSDSGVVGFIMNNIDGKSNSVGERSFIDDYSDSSLKSFTARCELLED